MTAPAGKLKRPSGWFAAGREVSRALAVLSDGAFRLFIYFCLNADRRTGQMRITHGELAKAVGRSRRSIIIYMDELQRQQVCQVQSATNQHASGQIEICDAILAIRENSKRRSNTRPGELHCANPASDGKSAVCRKPVCSYGRTHRKCVIQTRSSHRADRAWVLAGLCAQIRDLAEQ